MKIVRLHLFIIPLFINNLVILAIESKIRFRVRPVMTTSIRLRIYKTRKQVYLF